MGNQDRKKSAFHSSIYFYCIIHVQNVRLEKKIRTGTATNTYTREKFGKRHYLTWLTFFFRHFQTSVISSLQMPEL